ncbi:MAG: TonB-dependent receptor [Rhodanobacteraceae bacterium]|nr:MAG: TonB-dependent receptor [Rhodanobacteraceae bacterium]
MRLDRSELSKAVTTALSLGAVAAVGVAGTAFAQNATTTQNNQKKPQTLQTIVVTGSHIRRVDLETANPVTTVSAAQIQNSGALTLGDLVQDLPQITGSPQNPRVNNGGGSGQSGANLRGLGSGRTLVLIDGHRMLNQDLNIIPAELVERIEVLNDGGAVTYGSDAIAGVINFILKKNYQGAQFSANYGISDRGDGERKGASFIFGQTSDKGSILAGVDYNKQDGILSGARNFSKYALYRYYGTIYAFGSSRNPFGRAFLSSTVSVANGQIGPDGTPQGTKTTFYAPNNLGPGCGSATLNPGGNSGATSGYHCYSSANDSYNYQLLNYDLTPQERTNAFFKGDYQLTDNVQAYMTVLHNKTTSSSALAPLPFDANSDGVTISKYNMYNPFGVDFGPPQNNATYLAPGTKANPAPVPTMLQYNYLNRWVGLGQRKGENTTTTDQAILGLRGSIGSWNWDANYQYGHESFQAHTIGDLIYNSAFKQALGPSMLVNGVPTCVSTPGNASTAIANCTPLNIFDANSPASIANEEAYLATLFASDLTVRRQYSVDANGPLFSLPAGEVQLAVGADYRKEYAHNLIDYLAIANPTTGTCSAPQSACGSPLQGGFNVKEVYAEMLIPVLKDMPFARALNIDLGDRYSKYSLAGSTSNWKIAVEWRPIDDLLIRGTVQKVFRAPTLTNLFRGAAGSAPPFNDPCIGLSAAELSAHSAACQNVAPNSTFQQLQNGLSQATGVVSGSVAAGFNLQPEEGKSFDWGVVYSPHYIPGLTVGADLWRIYLNNTISGGINSATTIAGVCFADNSSPLCALIHRRANGQVAYFSEPNFNLGRLDTRGVDFNATYRIPQMSWLPGQFTVGLLGTYLSEYTDTTAPGIPGAQVYHIAGHYYNGFGSYPRVRGQVHLDWQDGPWNASWRVQYIGHEEAGSMNPAENQNGESGSQLYAFRIPTIVYNYAQVSYDIQPINTTLSVGVNNVFDKQPPIFTQSIVLNADTDVGTYDTIGRFYWARATVKF